VLIVGVVVALALASRDAGVHTAPLPIVTAPGVGTPKARPQGPEASSASPVQQAAGAEVPKAASEDRAFVTYRGKQLTAQVPAGWRMLEDEAQKVGYIESKWLNPAHPSDTLLIDASPATGLTLEQDAAPVHRELQGSHGYEELEYGPGDLAGVASWMWIFRVSGDQRVDYFFNRCVLGFGVLGSTVPSRFDGLRAVFRAVAQSVSSRCD
jgi:hypothetical protein